VATSSTTETVMEASICQLRFPPFSFNKLIHELNRSRTYHFKEVTCPGEYDGNQCERMRIFHVGESAGVVVAVWLWG